MMVVVAIAFIVSWTPFYIITFISQVQPRSFLKDSNFLFTMLLIHWFGFLHSCVNPFIYNFMNEKFHRNFQQIFHRCWIQRHSFRKNSSLLFGGSSSRSSRSNSAESSPCGVCRKRPWGWGGQQRGECGPGAGASGGRENQGGPVVVSYRMCQEMPLQPPPPSHRLALAHHTPRCPSPDKRRKPIFV